MSHVSSKSKLQIKNQIIIIWSIQGGGSLQPSEQLGTERLDLWEIPLSSQSAGGTYRGNPMGVPRFVARRPSQHVAVT
jgi:hypothetical protein